MKPKSQNAGTKQVSTDAAEPVLISDDSKNTAGPKNSLAESAFSLRKTGHDLRNALNVMRNAAYLLRRKLVAAGGEHVDLVDMIEESVKSAEIIATQIMEESVKSGEPPTSRAPASN